MPGGAGCWLLAAGCPCICWAAPTQTRLRQSGGSSGCPQCTSSVRVHLKHCSAPCSFNLGVPRAFSSAGVCRSDIPRASDNATRLQLAISTTSETTGTLHLIKSVILGSSFIQAVWIHPAQREPGAWRCVSRAKASCPQPCASSCSTSENNTSLPRGTLSTFDSQEATKNSNLKRGPTNILPISSCQQ